MKNQWTLRVRLTALAVAGLALTGVTGTPAYASDPRPVIDPMDDGKLLSVKPSSHNLSVGRMKM